MYSRLLISGLLLCSIKSYSALNVETEITFAEKQYTALAESIPSTGAYISTGDPFSVQWSLTNSDPWTVGFYAGSLWMLYKHTRDEKWRNLAIANQNGLFARQFDTGTHDVGFVLMSSYGHALELTGNSSYADFINQGAQALLGRFFSKYFLCSFQFSLLFTL